jgi:hypothetical protein
MPNITDLPKTIAQLPAEARARFERIFQVDVVVGELRLPDTMRTWAAQRFGSTSAVEQQNIVRVTNRISWDGALFNPLRSMRPMQHNERASERSSVKHQTEVTDIFADPLRTTSEDVFGRVRGKYCITASNVSKWEGQCGVLILDEPDPLKFTPDQMRDYIATAREWARLAQLHDPAARYFVWGWNAGLKAGASIPHAHMQMALGRGMHYARIEGLRQAAQDYRQQFGTSYFDDLLAAHDDVGLGICAGSLRGFIYLAPTCFKETWLYARDFDDDLAAGLHDVLRGLIDRTSTDAFNVFVTPPPSPLLPFEGRGEWEWRDFPVLVRIGDRGPASMVSSDIGWLDLYAHNVISTDPYAVKAQLSG